MAHYILMRLLGATAVLFAISLITFVLMHSVPGGPFDEAKMPLPEEVKQNILRSYGLDRPLPEQYVRYVWNALHLDFGYPYQSPGETVIGLIARVWPVSGHLGGMAFAIAITLGLGLGIAAGISQNSWIDYLTTVLATFGIITPPVVVAIGMILLFSTGLQWLPSGGWEEARTWIMPVITLSLVPMGQIARYARTSIIEALASDYVRTAHAKGLRKSTVITRHVLKNALIPLITVAGPILIHLVTGTIFVEAIFRVPGLGKFWVTSTFERDYPMLMGLSLLSAALVSLTYLASDILYVMVDPRVKYR
jgi:ABC-type dipeptide/oligopeptide/nickel transport system permease component